MSSSETDQHRKHHRFTRWVVRHLWHRAILATYHRLVPLPFRLAEWLAVRVLRHEVRKHVKKEGRK